MIRKFKYIKEYFEYQKNVMGMDLGDLASVEDGYYRMSLYDIDYVIKSDNTIIMKVGLSEIGNNSYIGKGTFRYTPSDIPGFTDVTAMELTGILDDVFEENPEAIIDLIDKIYDEIKR